MKKLNLLLSIVLIITISIQILPSLTVSVTPSVSAAPDSIELRIRVPEISIHTTRNYVELIIPGYSLLGEPGNPQLPYKLVRVLLPPTVNLTTINVSIIHDSVVERNISADIIPAPPLSFNGTPYWGKGKKIVDGKNILVYNNDNYFPVQPVRIDSFSRKGVYLFLVLRFNPVQYNPVRRTIIIHNDTVIRISYNLTTGRAGRTVVASTVLGNINWSNYVNSAIAKIWYSYYYAASAPKYDVVIVTTNAIVQGSHKLQDYISYLENVRGLKVRVITEDDYGSAVGQQRAVNIRNWLKSHYLVDGFKYVILIGNPDPDDTSDPNDSYGDVPMMMCWPRRGAADGYEKAPTDYFYADLTGNWDTNNDGYYCDYGNDTGVDFTPEVYVGRIPVYNNNYTELDYILGKIISYGSHYGSWRKRILIPVAISNYENEDGSGWSRTDGRDLPKYIIEDILPSGWGHYVLYERAGLDPVPTSAPYFSAALTRTNVLNEWKKGYGVVFWWAHGWYDGAYRKYWGSDDGDNVPESSEMVWEPFITSSDVDTLNDSAPAIVYQSSCLNGYPEYPSNLGYELLVHGAVVTVSASRVSWYIVGLWKPRGQSDNTEIGYHFVENLIKNGMPAGEALYEAKSSLPHDDGVWWMNLFDFNLYGDPTITLGFRTVDISIDSQPEGSGFITVDGVNITTPATFEWVVGSTHTLGAVEYVDEGNGTRYYWFSWSDGGARIHNFTVPENDTVVKAYFVKKYNVTIGALQHGVGTVTPSGVNWFSPGSTVNISAKSLDSDYAFHNWIVTGNISILNASSPVTKITVNSPGVVLANFSLKINETILRIANCTVEAGVINLTIKLVSPYNLSGAAYVIDKGTLVNISRPLDGAWDFTREFIGISFNATTYSDGLHNITIIGKDSSGGNASLTLYFNVRSLAKRYNLIALTLYPIYNVTAESLGRAIGPQATLIAAWNTTTQEFKGYSPGISDPKDDFPILLGEGYFVYLTNTAKFVEIGENL